jgi:uncharacterized protein
MDPIDILAKYYGRNSKTFEILVDHGRQIAGKAAAAAEKVGHLHPDLEFIKQAAMLHDIGIFYTDSPGLGCGGQHPYIRHGVLGGRLLESIGLKQFKPICERHVGAGISAEDVRVFNLPLPVRDMTPISIEEQIVCYADKFFSKNGCESKRSEEKTVKDILQSLKPFGREKVERFQKWEEMFGT